MSAKVLGPHGTWALTSGCDNRDFDHKYIFLEIINQLLITIISKQRYVKHITFNLGEPEKR